jgi:hypothetical protein
MRLGGTHVIRTFVVCCTTRHDWIGRCSDVWIRFAAGQEEKHQPKYGKTCCCCGKLDVSHTSPSSSVTAASVACAFVFAQYPPIISRKRPLAEKGPPFFQIDILPISHLHHPRAAVDNHCYFFSLEVQYPYQ